jgi:hypothetical protein
MCRVVSHHPNPGAAPGGANLLGGCCDKGHKSVTIHLAHLDLDIRETTGYTVTVLLSGE